MTVVPEFIFNFRVLKDHVVYKATPGTQVYRDLLEAQDRKEKMATLELWDHLVPPARRDHQGQLGLPELSVSLVTRDRKEEWDQRETLATLGLRDFLDKTEAMYVCSFLNDIFLENSKLP